MTGLDPEDSAPSPAGPQDTQSSDQSKSGLRQAWDAWTSRPENNAALLQFGLAMLQPRSPGQSAVGQFANAIGQGAEASDRNIASQQNAETQQANIEAKKSDSASRALSAKAYANQVAKMGGSGKNPGLQARILAQRSFNQWAAKPEDPTMIAVNNGQSTDPVVQALQGAFPDIKTKGDVLRNPQAAAAARAIFANQLAGSSEDDGSDDTGATAPSTPQSPAAAPATTPQSGPILVQTPAEARALPPGTRYRTPQGGVYIR